MIKINKNIPAKNLLKEKISKGSVCLGTTTQISSTELIEIQGFAGFDFVLIDIEHGGFYIDNISNLIMAAKTSNLTPIVRVPENNAVMITKVLDAGAEGIVIPHISNQIDAKKAVSSCHYNTDGRGACPFIKSLKYGGISLIENFEKINKEVLIIILIENIDGINNIDNIISIAGIDAVFIGPVDLSFSLGCKGNIHHPKVIQSVKKIITSCKSNHIPIIYPIGLSSSENLLDLYHEGIRIFIYGTDSSIFLNACERIVSQLSLNVANQ